MASAASTASLPAQEELDVDDATTLLPSPPPYALASLAPPPPSPLAVAGASLATRHRYGDLAQALLCLVSVALIWVAAAAAVQLLNAQTTSPLPFTMTYANNSEFVVLLPLSWLRERLTLRVRGRTLLAAAPRSDWYGAARAGVLVCPLWFLAQGAYNAALSATSVSSSTVLSSSSCVFTLAFSILVLREAFRWPKLVGVLATVAGAACVAVADRGGGGSGSGGDGGSGGGGLAPAAPASHWWGDALALFAAVMYGAYTTAIKVLVPDGSAISMTVFFGFLGLFNSLLFAPIVVALVVSGAERPGDLPPPLLALVLAKGLFDNVLSDVLWARAIQLTSPTLATVALSLTIPFSIASDFMLHAAVPDALALAGAAAVMGGFMLTTLTQDPNRGAEAGAAVAEEAGAAAAVDAAGVAAAVAAAPPGIEEGEGDGGDAVKEAAAAAALGSPPGSAAKAPPAAAPQLQRLAAARALRAGTPPRYAVGSGAAAPSPAAAWAASFAATGAAVSPNVVDGGGGLDVCGRDKA